MRPTFAHRTTLAVVGLLALGLLTLPAVAQGQPDTTGYEVTVTNTTTGQPNTPPVYALHNGDATPLFTIGEPASEGIREIAENGNLMPLVGALDGASGVLSSGILTDGDEPRPIPAPGTPGEAMFPSSLTTVLDPVEGATQFSVAWMLICTNDGFTGVNAVDLPAAGETVDLELVAYETGSEINTEDFADIVPPCQPLTGLTSADEGTDMSNPALGEGGVITTHPGIEGGNDLDPDVHTVAGTVNTVTITALTDQTPSEGARTSGRLEGDTRVGTALAISQAAFPNGADVVYLANADTFVDAVAGGVLTDGPIILVPQCGELPADVGAEIARVDPDRVIALGGSAAICDALLAAAADA